MRTIDVIEHGRQGWPNDWSRLPAELKTVTMWRDQGRKVPKSMTPAANLVYRAGHLGESRTGLYTIDQTVAIKRRTPRPASVEKKPTMVVNERSSRDNLENY